MCQRMASNLQVMGYKTNGAQWKGIVGFGLLTAALAPVSGPLAIIPAAFAGRRIYNKIKDYRGRNKSLID